MHRRGRLLRPLALAAFLLATPALADPCTAPLPKKGTEFSGTVRYVGDGDSACIGTSADPATWVEVRLADFYAPELNEPGGRQAKHTLERVAKGKRAVCVAEHKSHDRVVAVCRIGGSSVGDLMRAAGVREGGRGAK